MWIILGLFLSLSALALEPFERLNSVKILKTLPDNIILLDRGLEDGLNKNDHIKLSNEAEGFSSRAICLKSSATTSYWKLYRVPNAEAFSKDYLYTIAGFADREIPSPISQIRGEEQEIIDPTGEKKTDPGPDPFIIKRDLPEKLSERDLIEAVGPERRRLFVEQALDKDQLKRDLTDYRFSVFASPFTRQSINNSESLRYGFRGGNIASKYRFLTQYEQQQSKMRDPFTEESVSTRSVSGQAQFVIHRLTRNVSSLSLINYNSTHFSRFGTPRNHWQVGPIGFTWHLHESKTWEYLDLSYIPLYDLRTTDTYNEGAQEVDRTTGLRHGFRFAVKNRINERVALENVLWVRPYQDLATWEIESDNLNLVNDLKLVFSLTQNLYFDYNFVYQKDKVWKKLNNLPQFNTINSLNLRYDFNL